MKYQTQKESLGQYTKITIYTEASEQKLNTCSLTPKKYWEYGTLYSLYHKPPTPK